MLRLAGLTSAGTLQAYELVKEGVQTLTHPGVEVDPNAKDEREALKWFCIAADKGNHSAQRWLKRAARAGET